LGWAPSSGGRSSFSASDEQHGQGWRG
jgi:hypothetical protein